jgi:esterase/lipase superfamily enzyme
MNTGKSPIDARHRSGSRQLFLSCILSAMLAIQLLALAYSAGAETGQQKKQDSSGQEAEIIPVTFVTLRNKTGSPDPAEYFGGNRGMFYTGVCSVAFTPIRGLEEISESAPFYIPDEKIELTDIVETAPDAFFDQINQFSRQGNDNIVVYVHGYNIDFEKGCRRSAIFQRALGPHNRLVLFSWPADGNMLKYTWDESDLVWSVPYMADFLSEIIKQAGEKKIDVVAHSLGARGMIQALVRLASEKPGVRLIN